MLSSCTAFFLPFPFCDCEGWVAWDGSSSYSTSTDRKPRPYRAPETLFGTQTYDPFAVDSWSLGVLFADFFTRLRFNLDVDDVEDDFVSDEEIDPALPPFAVPQEYYMGARGVWSRDSLFDASRGSIGLAWSIFKVRGSPSPEDWPVRSNFVRKVALR